MSCTHFEERWDGFLTGSLSDVEQRAAAAHLQGCAGCTALVNALREVLAELPAAAASAAEMPSDLAINVLARTSGGACGAAQDRLCALVDGLLPAADAGLVETHLLHCTRCASLRTTLVWLGTTLPAMAMLDPGPDFTRDVVAATAPQPKRPAPWRAAFTEHWQRLVARPRFAWEAAYVGLLLLVALFGTSVSPFRDVPPRALAAVQIDPRGALQNAGSRARNVHGGIGVIGQTVWNLTGGAIGRGIAYAADSYADRHPGMHDAYGNLQLHAGAMRQHIGDRNFAAASVSLYGVRDDLRALWRSGFGGGDPVPPATPP